MLTKCLSRIFIRRYRPWILYTIILCLCIYIYYQNTVISNISSDSNSEDSLSNVTCQHVTFNKPELNCSGDPLRQWCDNAVHLCDSSLIIYHKLFIITHSTIVQRQFAQGKRSGGEEIHAVLNQPEQDEYFQFGKNFIQVNLRRCTRHPSIGSNDELFL